MRKMLMQYTLISVFLFHALPSLSAPSGESKSFPNVELGYATHAPTFLNVTESGITLANYNNIRYAQPPTGDLRFRKPQTPPPSESGVKDGLMNPTPDCVSSAHPGAPFPGINGTHWGTEDCLFLNVRVPEGVKAGDKVPVIHWIHGSAYSFGSKDLLYTSLDSIGLFSGIKRPEEKFIFVANNYRLGLYGWSSSPFEEDMDANVGLHDSVAAVEWTKKYIERFGGDPDRITVIGQSAGAGIINMMLTSNGGIGKLPFSKAILSSPGIMPRRNVTARRQEVYEQMLKTANCTTLTCLKDIPEDDLKVINHQLVTEGENTGGGGAFGPGIGFGPVVDDSYVPDAPQVLLDQGRFHKEVESVISSNTLNEGQGTSSDEDMPERFPDYFRMVFPGASDATVKRVQDMFAVKEGEPPEKLAWDWFTSVFFACNSWGVSSAYSNLGKARRYFLSAPPAFHGFDILYFFFINSTITPVVDAKVALNVQSYIRNVVSAKSAELPTPPDAPVWPLYGQESKVLNIKESELEIVDDPWGKSTGICRTLLDIALDPENEA
ncbi:hypothetical protein AJ79_00543 [Helicocarpus griseus UAMH5409]|uniref:Carboxylic ester hydrolase n=1 Tax=Helicocarpus griseus UAMH5409 TaxID=1447875 RepID=A0A2B7YAC0_9EURO|nr:hypothetical protein AJ79_00543 [Helicocarpus griseus UAMH5409]